jgi:methyltransferase family protein
MSFSLDETLIRRILRETGPAAQQTDVAAASLGFGLVHYSIVRALDATRALVIGSKQGFVPICQALAMRDSGRGGRVVLVDPGFCDVEDGFERGMGGIGFWRNEAEVSALFAAFEVAEIVEHRAMTSQAFFGDHRCRTERFHLVYIDGDHGYQGFGHDFAAAFTVLDDDGLVMFHDSLVTERSIESIGGSFGAFDYLEREGKRLFDDIEILSLPMMPGLGFARRSNPQARGVLARNFAVR